MAILRDEYWWVYLRAGNIHWARRHSGVTETLSSGSCSEIADLPAPLGARIVLCVPGESVRVHVVDLPARKRSQFMSALPFALEDVLLREPEAYHLTPLAQFKARSKLPVAVVEHASMTEWLELIRTNGWIAQFFIADYMTLVLPQPDTWLLDMSESPFLLRRSDQQCGAAFSGELCEKLPAVLLLALENTDERPCKLRVRVSNPTQRALVSKWQAQLDTFNIMQEIVEDETSRTDWLMSFLPPHAELNLLTGIYKTSNEDDLSFKRTIPAISALLAIVLVFSAQWLFQYSSVKRQHEMLHGQLESTFLQAFPDAKNIIDPRFQMQQKLDSIQQPVDDSGDQPDLLSWLEKLAQVVSSGSKYVLESLHYDGSKLTVDLNVTDYLALDNLQKKMSMYGEVIVDNAELRDKQVHAKLIMQEHP